MTQCPTFAQFDREAKRLYLQWLLRTNGHNVAKCARACRLNRTYLYEVFRKYGIQLRHPKTKGVAVIPRELMANLVAHKLLPASSNASGH